MAVEIECCATTEWWSRLFSGLGQLPPEDVVWCEEEYWQRFVELAEEEPRLRGVDFIAARGDRGTFHGWNGTQWVWTCGLLGAWWTPGRHARAALERCEKAAYAVAVRCIAACRQRLEDERRQAEEDEIVMQAMREQGDCAQYSVAFVREQDGEFEVVESFYETDDDAANRYCEEHYDGQEWYLLDSRGRNANGGLRCE
jgi:hypothetical protein